MCLKDLFNKPAKPFVYGNNCLLHFAVNNYPGSGSDLRGCVDDQEDTTGAVDKRIGGVSMRYLKDEQCTPSAFEDEIRAAYKAMPKGLLTVGYSGHGTYEKDADEPDGYREALYLYGGKFTDDRLIALANEKPAGLDLVFILDCCFSQGMARDMLLGNPQYKRPRFLLTEPLPPNAFIIRSTTRAPHDFLLLSACAENQTAADAFINNRYNGAFTFYAVRTLEKGITYRQWMERIWQSLPSEQFEQIPGIDGPERLTERKIFETL